MKTRAEMQTLLETALGNSNVYFQEPPNTGMKYPCMVYRFVNLDVENASNKPYLITGRWEVHHMYKNPLKHDLKEKMIFIAPYVSYDRRIVIDGVYNDFYTIYQ
jgi:hypothetical protein